MTPEDVKKIRKDLGWTSKQLAEHLGVCHNTVRRWECGINGVKGPVVRLLQQLAKKATRKMQTA